MGGSGVGDPVRVDCLGLDGAGQLLLRPLLRSARKKEPQEPLSLWGNSCDTLQSVFFKTAALNHAAIPSTDLEPQKLVDSADGHKI
jgi:hypothetical protein